MECSAKSRLDGLLVQQLKESVCHLDPSLWGTREHQFSVMSPTPQVLLDYNIKLADEAIFAPMGVFFPSAFCLPDDWVLMVGQEVASGDSEDVYDEANWVTEGQAQQVKAAASKAVGMEASLLPTAGDTFPEATKRLQIVAPGKILGLDQAIHFSIDCACESLLHWIGNQPNLILHHALPLASFPGCSHLQSLIACSMEGGGLGN